MPRFKILVGTAFLILALFVLMALSVNKPVPTSEFGKATVSTLTQKKPVVDQNELRRYKSRQNELKVALKAYFNKAIASGDIVGAGVSIVRGDSILISHGFGKRSIDTEDKVDGETVFRRGSLSKGLAGVLAAELNDEGKLDWEDKIT
ncbi:MAG: serine hydrolase, partial [Aurantibacter sp.]